MARRSKLPTVAEEKALTLSRRRCSLCFGLYRDATIKKGQIAHLNGNSADNDIDNLVFLSFNHHDEYDSTTRQAKGITTAELRRYREELS